MKIVGLLIMRIKMRIHTKIQKRRYFLEIGMMTFSILSNPKVWRSTWNSPLVGLLLFRKAIDNQLWGSMPGRWKMVRIGNTPPWRKQYHRQRIKIYFENAFTLLDYPETRYLKCNIGNNKIGNEGINHLSKADWPSLEQIFMCKHTFIKKILEDFHICPNAISPTLTN